MAADLLSIGKSGLFTAKQSMTTTSHNIANANTEGFSKQDVKTKTGVTIHDSQHIVGTGVDIQSIKRAHDELIEKKYNNSLTANKFNEERFHQLGNVEEIFNEINSEGMNKILNRFFNSFRELSTQPENPTVRSVLRENAKIVINDFHRIYENLDTTTKGINNKINLGVLEINSLSQQIARLNKEINVHEVSTGMANDLRDQRDIAIRKLAEFFPVHTYTDNEGQFVVSVDGVGSIVSGSIYQEIASSSVLKEGSTLQDRGQVEIFFKARPSQPFSDKIRSGTFGALLKTRNNDIAALEKQLNQMAHGLIMSTNAIHRRGFAHISVPEDENGNPILSASNRQLTGINFFKEPVDLKNAAESIQLDEAIEEDINNIVTALEPNKPGDNRISIAISKLQHEKILAGGTTTFEEQYLKSIGEIGLQAGKSKIDLEQSAGILSQAKSVKERLTGVSLDEEAANMVKYQNAYEASAKVIKASDEMFKAVLGLLP